VEEFKGHPCNQTRLNECQIFFAIVSKFDPWRHMRQVKNYLKQNLMDFKIIYHACSLWQLAPKSWSLSFKYINYNWNNCEKDADYRVCESQSIRCWEITKRSIISIFIKIIETLIFEIINCQIVFLQQSWLFYRVNLMHLKPYFWLSYFHKEADNN